MIITCACGGWKHTAGNQQTKGLRVLGVFRGITDASTAILEGHGTRGFLALKGVFHVLTFVRVKYKALKVSN
ncbi:hypothetical protein CJU81_20530 [Pseudomonas fragi]|uniref:Uncharacterized protein n=1 Tax=Pseudomonas fragi TaxID=296 RepID=A0A267A4C0_PSEFR|nr:hypothetical protein CJU81_20530 [Pseudomonas fragi]